MLTVPPVLSMPVTAPAVAGLDGIDAAPGPARIAAALAAVGAVAHKEVDPKLDIERPVGHTTHNLFVRCKKNKDKFYLVTLRQVRACDAGRASTWLLLRWWPWCWLLEVEVTISAPCCETLLPR